ncbi:MAG: TIGR04348 family glycosyltransferase [Betaproteobacteria bacterium]|nr:TIGR04348 family glycosyltransferase [Betaproteobacteria bacterium]
MKIAITVPAAAAPRSGNHHTAERWARFLRGLRHRVRIVKSWRSGNDELLIALHARKSSESVRRFSDRRPDAPIVLALTGTDLYRDIREAPEARQSLGLASRLIVLQEQGLRELSPFLRQKTRVVYQSSDAKLRHLPDESRFRVAVIGHLREEKDPFRAVMAIRRLGGSARVEVLQIGAALNREMKSRCNAWAKLERRYRWLGSVAHDRALRLLASSHVLVVSSVMEGGANVICEAGRIGVPVLASRVPGNIGMLGREYPGYFPLRDDRALARLIERCRTDASFYSRLKRAVIRRRRQFAPDAERAALKRALQGLHRDGRNARR